MKLLAIDTSASACSIALAIDNTLYTEHCIAPMQQAQLVLPLIESLLKQANVRLNDLDALAFGCGPGSFTGVRIAASIAQGLAYAANLPLIKISSLAALAQATFNELGWKSILVAVDARIQEVYWGAYRISAHGIAELQDSEVVCSPNAIPVPESQDWYAAGGAFDIYADALLKRLAFTPLAIDSSRLSMASGIITLATKKFQQGEFTALQDAMPVYLRDNVAKKMRG